MTDDQTTDEAERHRRCSANFARIIDGVADWSAPTPVAEWQARDVVDHLLTWLPPVVASWTGVELTPVPDGDQADQWRHRTAEIQSLLEEPAAADQPVTDGPFAGRTLAQVIDAIYTADVFMHSWDLARASGQDPQLDPGFAAELVAGMRAMADVLRSSGQFGEEQPTSSTDPVDQLVAFIGRSPTWPN